MPKSQKQNSASQETQSAPKAVEESSNATQSQVSAPTEVPFEERVLAAIGYFGFLFLVPLVAKPKSEYCAFHVRQSMVLFLTFFLYVIVLAASELFGSILGLPLFGVYVISIYKSFMGQKWEIPGISVLAAQINLNDLYKKSGLAIKNISGMAESMASQGQKIAEKGVEKLSAPNSKEKAQDTAQDIAPAKSTKTK